VRNYPSVDLELFDLFCWFTLDCGSQSSEVLFRGSSKRRGELVDRKFEGGT